MKLDLFLFFFALLLAFVSGNITYFIKSDDAVDFKDLDEIRKLHIELQEEIKPYKRLDLNIDYSTKEHLKLLEDTSSIPSKNKRIILNSSECLKSKLSQITSSFINKETLWLAYLCNQVEKLPSTFFNSPPFLHSNGMSYSFMRYKMIQSPQTKMNWLEKNANFMHISEVKNVHWPTNISQRFLLNQPQEVINRILKGENTFLSPQFYFIKTGNLKYYILNKNMAQRFFKRARYSFSSKSNACIFKIGNVCWKKKPHNLKSLLSQSTFVLFFGTLIILVLTANSLYNRLRRKKLEEERKKHALRILTHELRTPIASLLLQVNQINKNIEEIPLETQDQLLKIESQVYRLKHLAEKSSSYLQTNDTELIALNKVSIPSLKEYCEELLFEYEENQIKLNIINDTDVVSDPYWLRMCIGNLIENALRYGKAPIELEINSNKESISIIVRDHGEIPYLNIKELLKSKHNSSKGLGLGLIIVNKTLKEMGAKLSLSSNPTEFKILLTKNKREQNDKDFISRR